MELDKIKRSKSSHLRKNIFSIMILIIGVVVLCATLALIQNRSAESNQKKNSEKILEDVIITLENNDLIVSEVLDDYNSINQTTLSMIAQYIDYTDVLKKVKESTGEEQRVEILKSVDVLKKICNDTNVTDVLIANEEGLIVLGSNASYLGQNVPSDVQDILVYDVVDEQNKTNGTLNIVDGKYIYSPLNREYNGQKVALYSTYFTSSEGENYYLITYNPSEIIDQELESLKSVGQVLEGITIGKTGFLFAVDNLSKKFLYFNNGVNDLTGEDFDTHCTTNNQFKENDSEYRTIDDVEYFCVSKTFSSKTYGDLTVVVAAVAKDEIISKNIWSIVSSCIGFILVACIVAGYGLILRREIVDHILSLENKTQSIIKEDAQSKGIRFTDEEVAERSRIVIYETIEKGKDKKLKRKNIGVRNSKGKQLYFSLYMAVKMIAVTVIGLFAIFVISYFSQTLLELNDVTQISEKRLNEIESTINTNVSNTNNVKEYVDNQFLSKARIVSYILENDPEIMFLDSNENNYHKVYEQDINGQIEYLKYDDYPLVQRYAISHCEALQYLCDNNVISSIYVYSDDGRCLATNSEYWYFKLSKNEEDQSYPFNDILYDKIDYYIQDEMTSEITGKNEKFIGTEFFYYTYLDGNNVGYASKNQYESYSKNHTWDLSGENRTDEIKKHRSLIQIGVDQVAIDNLFQTTEISYILDNMHVYGNESFFIAFDKSDDHNVIYSPYKEMIGKTANQIGITNSAFVLNGTYNGFQKMNGTEYYQSIKIVGDYYITTAIPTTTIYESRNSIAAYTLLFSAIFIVIASGLFIVSSDKSDKDYCNVVKYKTDFHVNNNSFVLTTPSGKKRRTKSISARFSKTPWSKKTPEEKLSAILMFYMTIASVLIVIALLYALNSLKHDTIFSYIFSTSWERGFNIFAITESLMIMIFIITITKLTQICVRSFCGTLGSRIETTGNLIVSVLKYGGIIAGLFYCLYLFGFNTASILTSAGILSIVIGLGAQSLIGDILAGIFIIFEGSFRVGDIVTIGDFRGQVLEIGLRTTKIEDVYKNIKIFNNSSISGVLNMTKRASYASVEIGIEYSESIERVEAILRSEFPKIKRRIPEILDGPFYQGIQELGESSVIIRIIAQCEEKDRIQLTRDLNREVFLLFNKNNINIPFPQLTISRLKEDTTKVTNKMKVDAQKFVEEQKKLAEERGNSETD